MMKFGPSRGNFMFIFHKFFSSFFILLALLIFFTITGQWSMLLEYNYLIFFVVISPISRIISFLTTYYSIDDQIFYIKKAFIVHKNTEIPLSAITNVDFSQGPIFRIAKVYIVTVDSAGGGQIKNSKLSLALKENVAVEFKEFLLHGRSKVETPDAQLPGSNHPIRPGSSMPLTAEASADVSQYPVLKAPLRDIILMGLLDNKILGMYKVFAFVGVIITFASRMLINNTIDGESFIADKIFSLQSYTLIILVLLILYIMALLSGMVNAFIKYYDFHIINHPDIIYIRYGFFTRKTHALDKKNITGIQYSQSLMLRALKLGRLDIFAIGYGRSEENPSAMLFPLVRRSALFSFLNGLVPQTFEEATVEKAPRRGFFLFFISPRFVAATAIFAISFLYVILAPNDLMWDSIDLSIYGRMSFNDFVNFWWVACALILGLAILSTILEYKNTGFYSTSRCTALSFGGFTKKTSYMKTGMLQSITSRGTITKRRKLHLASLKFCFWGSPLVANQSIRNMDLSAFEKIKEHLIY